MTPYIYIIIPGEGIALVTDAELSRLCASGRQWWKIRLYRGAKGSEHVDGNERAGKAGGAEAGIHGGLAVGRAAVPDGGCADGPR